MRTFDITLPRPKGRTVQIHVCCCLHIGHFGHAREEALAFRDHILKTPDTYVISLGDDMDNAIPGDDKHNSMMFDNRMTPEEQYVHVCEYWRCVAEKGKLLWTADSNHWWRSEAKTGISLAKQLNEYLKQNSSGGKPHWGRWQSLASVKVGKAEYLIHSWHGVGNAKGPEGALRKCREAAGYVSADVYLMGHAHKKVVYQDYCFEKSGGKINEKVRSFGVTGSFLGWHDGYAERSGMAPAARGAIYLELSTDRHNVRISL